MILYDLLIMFGTIVSLLTLPFGPVLGPLTQLLFDLLFPGGVD